MSLSTLLEAAKYLDYLDSNKQVQQAQQQQQQQTQQPQLHFHTQRSQPTIAKKTSRRQRSSRKDAANTMLAMSLPTSTAPIQMPSRMPMPLATSIGNNGETHNHHQAASLSSSFTTGSPLSSFASTALLCSKVSGVTSASSSAASSLSSSDTSSSCGDILMGDNDFSQANGSGELSVKASSSKSNHHRRQQQILDHNQYASTPPNIMGGSGSGTYADRNQSFARYIAATSSGPQLVTMTTSSAGLTSTSAPIDGRMRAGHVLQAANNLAGSGGARLGAGQAGVNFDSRHFSIATTSGLQADGQSFGIGNDNHLGSSPMIVARVQPMVLNSISPSAQQSIMAFQPATGTSPSSPSSSYSRHRELHKTLEKNRRAHLRHCFEILKAELPTSECADKKASHINIIKSAIRYVLALRKQECEIDNELQRLTRIKNELTDKLSKNNGGARVTEQLQQNQQQASTSAPLATEPYNTTDSPIAPKQEQHSPQQPVAEQQLSLLLSQSKID